MERLLTAISRLKLGTHPQVSSVADHQLKSSAAALSRTLCSTSDGTRLFLLGADGGLWLTNAEELWRSAQRLGEESRTEFFVSSSGTLGTPVHLTPALRFKPIACALSSSDRFLALYDEEFCAVVDLQTVPSSQTWLDQIAPAPVTAPAVLLGSRTSQRAAFTLRSIRQVSWHPWSDGRLAILYDDGMLELYDTLEATLPEQTLRIRLPLSGSEAPAATGVEDTTVASVSIQNVSGALEQTAGQRTLVKTEAPAAFAFGPLTEPSEYPWELVTLYLLRESDGALFILCPFAPTGLRLPAVWVEAVHGQLETGALADTATSSAADATTWAELQMRLRREWLALCTSRQARMDLESHRADSEKAPPVYRLLRPPRTFNMQWTPLLQGPVHIEHDAATAASHWAPACGIQVLPSPLGPLLLRTWWHGVLDVLVTMEKVEPVWAPSSECSEQLPAEEDVAPSLLLYERIFTGAPCAHSIVGESPTGLSTSCAANDEHLPLPWVSPAQTVPRLQRSVLLIRSHQGVSALYLTWLDMISHVLSPRSWPSSSLFHSEPDSNDEFMESEQLEQLLEQLPCSTLVQSLASEAAPLGLAELRLPSTVTLVNGPAANLLLAMDADGEHLRAAALHWWRLPSVGASLRFPRSSMTTRELEYTDLVHACSPAVKAGAAAASTTTTTTVATKIRSASGLTPLEQKLTQVFGSLVPWHTSGVSHAAATGDAQELWEQTRTLVLLWQMIQTIIQPLRLFYAQTLSSTIEQLPLRLETNARQYSYLQHRLEMLQSRARDLDHRIRILATGMNENLQKRAAGLSELLLHRKPMITPLERQCFRQLERYRERLCEFQQRLTQLQRQAAAARQSGSRALPELDIREDWSLLRKTQQREIRQAIEENTRRLERLCQVSQETRASIERLVHMHDMRFSSLTGTCKDDTRIL
ncbi:hypothetical protein CYME_CMO203C [Cyanidioschyzon merolae strain 10D]|uniref:Uncharacterized protein n=1 Tax=Cyanidioschyzon merolae (strain NIES-3377 / 10D) TaxID=280699 RepID=M1UUK3_CYAM1|nr:hypothetical protein CYME_CMO203C [Cyanidioschyzon merolae strain 10D]BAM81556.1 hypothetical protein CYME_CMO203C [Cyanidioschyzon merolae strain 10D]|eukprot:XP_005537592.1 hypothetical protein CYME_CMO203C [Cyanidioschyzon merolae strain 10D]